MNTDKSIIPLHLPTNSIDAYMHSVSQIPMLSESEEKELAIRLTQTGDLAAAKQLILPHLRYVVKVAKGYAGYGLPLNDLIQEGNIGLMKAVKRFNPNVGARLVTFAIHWIKAEIHDFVLRNWRIVKVATTKAQRKLFFNLRSMKKNLSWFTQDEINEVAKDLGVKPETVREMEMRLAAADASLDYHEEDEDDFISQKYLEDHRYNPSHLLEHQNSFDHNNSALQEAFKQLDERSQAILNARWLKEKKATLQDLADEYKVSAERIRQLEKMAMDKLKIALQNISS